MTIFYLACFVLIILFGIISHFRMMHSISYLLDTVERLDAKIKLLATFQLYDQDDLNDENCNDCGGMN